MLGTLCATISHTAVLELVSPGFTDFQGRSSSPFPPFIYPCYPQWIIIDSPGWPLLFRTCFFILMVHLIVDYDRLEKITWLSGSRSDDLGRTKIDTKMSWRKIVALKFYYLNNNNNFWISLINVDKNRR